MVNKVIYERAMSPRVVCCSIVCLTLLLMLGCKQDVELSEAFGCVNTFDGEEMSCTELDPTVTEEQRKTAAANCTNQTVKHLGGRVVRNCATEGVIARCLIPAESATILFYEKTSSPKSLKGHEIGCKVRGGTFEGRMGP